MYYIKDNVDLKWLEKYGFKLGRELPDNEKWIDNNSEKDDYWIVSMSYNHDRILYGDCNFYLPFWTMHVQKDRRLWVECVPATCHITNDNLEEMFYTLKCMIDAGIIIDDFRNKEV